MDHITARTKLQKLESELDERLQGVTRDLAKTHSQDFAEQATERENEEVLLRLREDASFELAQIKQANKRIDDGTYGVCDKCGIRIKEERLEIMPYTSRCSECAV